MTQRPTDPARATLMRDKNFVWLMLGASISLLGDQFTLVALPWLVLRMTGDTLVLGMVLGLMSLPRALFILIDLQLQHKILDGSTGKLTVGKSR